jgi:hypothetical protein
LLATLAIEMAYCARRAGYRRARADRNSAMLSVHVFQDGSRFGWTLNVTGQEVLGHGTAATEFEARVDAFQSAMTYIDHSNGRATAGDESLH